jgi:hypothetical protein
MMYLKSGSTYVGQFVNNMMHGYGKLNFKDGRVYEGDFKDDTPTG